MSIKTYAFQRPWYDRTRIAGDRCGTVVKEKIKRTKIPVSRLSMYFFLVTETFSKFFENGNDCS